MSTIRYLIAQIREDFLDDTEKDKPLWADSTIGRALAQSEREIAKRCLLLQDSITSAICYLPLVADPVIGGYSQTIPLSSKILRVQFVLFPNSSAPHKYSLGRTTTAKMNKYSRETWGHDRGWIGRSGRVERYMTDFQYKSLTFDHVPHYGGTVQIGVIRLP